MARANPSFAHRLGWRLEAFGYDFVSFLLRLLPVDWASAVGGAVVRLIGPLTREHRIADAGVQLAFPELTPEERRRIVMAHWDNLGRTAIEFVMMDRILKDPARIEVLGSERLLELSKRRAPAIAISGHFANWEAMGAAVGIVNLEMMINYRPANNPYVDRRIVESRSKHGVHLFAPKGREGVRGLVQALGRGELIGFVNDQRDNNGVEAPFFGHMVRTAQGPARLALAHDVPIYPISVERLRGPRFRVRVHDPIRPEHSGDRERDMHDLVARINAYMEARIRERPEQWLWSHRRWPWEAYEAIGLKLR
ncbi:MAG TPA: lysophospholipid acyltransferase family protein [Caulobacteraceae bacterium]|jgi:KDO2-lipid IV(A) lauroyltransferase